MSLPGPVNPVEASFGVRARLGRLGRLVRKELNEILRDRRTIITLVLMPLLLYPILSIAFQQLLLAGHKSAERPEYWLGFRSEGECLRAIRQMGWMLDREKGEILPLRGEPMTGAKATEPSIKGRFPVTAQEKRDLKYLEKLVLGNAVELGIRVRQSDNTHGPEAREVLELVYLETSARAVAVARWMERQCALANLERLKGHGEAVLFIRAPTKDPQAGEGNFLAALVPLILILMTITGAVYPAIDLTAGERERGTLEILVAAPVPRLGLLFAKYLTVLTVAVLTALVNLVMMTVTLLATGLGPQLFGNAGLSVVAVVEVFGLLLLFAAFFSAVLLALTSFARSFKEAQAYLIPLMLMSLAPGMLAMNSSLKLEGLLPVAPLINIVLLARDLFHGDAVPGAAVAVILSTLFYALAALAIAARIFGAEGVLYSEQGSWADLFRRPADQRPTATVSGALLSVAVLFPVYFFVNSAVAHLAGAGLEVRIGLAVAATVLLFGAVPLGFAAMGRVRLTTGFQLHAARWPAFLGAGLLGLSLWPFVLEIMLAVQSAGLATLGEEQQKLIDRLVTQWRQLSPVVIVLAYGLVPAVLEELFFRGYLFSALRAHARPATAIFASALLFGLFHIVFAFDRLLPSTLLGVVLGWVCWKTGSVVPGMVLHAFNNSFLVLVSYYAEWIKGQELFDPEKSHLPPSWLAGAALGTALGALLIVLAGRKHKGNIEPQASLAE
jgi:ABC-2 type transport system permease protein/sodium transport system permease protein